MSTEELKCPQPVPEVGEPIPGGEEVISENPGSLDFFLGKNNESEYHCDDGPVGNQLNRFELLEKSKIKLPVCYKIYPRCHCYNTNR